MDGRMKDQDIFDEAKDRYQDATDGWDHIYNEASNDLKFVYDVDEGQWPENIRNERERDNRPVITVNKLQKFVRQLRGESQLNRPRIKVIPVDNAADVNMAELYNGIIRQVEYLSDANIAYDTAYMHAVSCSVGYFRLITKYTDDNSFDQDLYIKRIINPFSVHFDPMATEFELEDARYCFIEELIDEKQLKRLYPKADSTNYDGSKRKLFGGWLQGNKLRVAEYFWKELIKKKIVQLETGETIELSKEVTPEFITEKGGIITREREVNTHKVMWCKMNGAEILEKKEWAGKHIPVIPVFGDEIVADGKKYYLSLIRGAKGSQQMYNYWSAAATETVALAPKMPYMVDHRQIKGLEPEWEEAHRTNRPYIRYNAIAGLTKPEREQQTEIPGAIMAMMQNTAYDIEDHLGRYEASKGQASNERSGKAIVARIQQADKGTYTYVDNLTRAIVYAGRQLIDLIPKIYDTQRALRIQGEGGKEQLVNVNVPVTDGRGGIGVANDLSVGKYDLIATVGASFSSKRQEMTQLMIESMQYAPGIAGVIAPLIFKYADFPGAEEIYQEIKKAMEQMQQNPPEKK